MRALISVSDKTNIVDFAKNLQKMGWGILSTGGTWKVLNDCGVKVTGISDYTNAKEMLDGRVKTLHPKIHAGILALRKNQQHMNELKEKGISLIDMVVVNLYPFEQTVAKGADFEEAIEQIDIGGPSLLRAAAKNFQDVIVIVDPMDYEPVLDEMKRKNGKITKETRLNLARKVFQHTAHYDRIIGDYLSGKKNNTLSGKDKDIHSLPGSLSADSNTNNTKFPNIFNLTLEKVQDLRYGENPHQQAALYKMPGFEGTSIATARQLQGKELSFNNILDMSTALRLAMEFDKAAAVILKHNNPCGVATAETQLDAYKKAYSTDTVSPYGGIVAFNKEITAETAKEVASTFIECVIAPSFESAALEILKEKKNLRLLEVDVADSSDKKQEHKTRPKNLNFKHVLGGLLVQDSDEELYAADLKVVTKRNPTKEEMEAMKFAWIVCKHVKSNAITYARPDRTIGIGAGQMSRVDSAKIAKIKAEVAGSSTKGCAMASDAFFPFRDSVDTAAEAGITAIIQPGGSKRDDEVIQACNEHNIAMVFTGMRHFNH